MTIIHIILSLVLLLLLLCSKSFQRIYVHRTPDFCIDLLKFCIPGSQILLLFGNYSMVLGDNLFLANIRKTMPYKQFYSFTSNRSCSPKTNACLKCFTYSFTSNRSCSPKTNACLKCFTYFFTTSSTTNLNEDKPILGYRRFTPRYSRRFLERRRQRTVG